MCPFPIRDKTFHGNKDLLDYTAYMYFPLIHEYFMPKGTILLELFFFVLDDELPTNRIRNRLKAKLSPAFYFQDSYSLNGEHFTGGIEFS